MKPLWSAPSCLRGQSPRCGRCRNQRFKAALYSGYDFRRLIRSWGHVLCLFYLRKLFPHYLLGLWLSCHCGADFWKLENRTHPFGLPAFRLCPKRRIQACSGFGVYQRLCGYYYDFTICFDTAFAYVLFLHQPCSKSLGGNLRQGKKVKIEKLSLPPCPR